MLRLVHPRKEGQVSARKIKKSASLFPTPEEADRIRATMRSLRYAYGGWDVLAGITGIKQTTLENIAHRQSPGSYGVAIAIARAAGIPVEQILRPGVQEAGKCPVCGRKGAR